MALVSGTLLLTGRLSMRITCICALNELVTGVGASTPSQSPVQMTQTKNRRSRPWRYLCRTIKDTDAIEFDGQRTRLDEKRELNIEWGAVGNPRPYGRATQRGTVSSGMTRACLSRDRRDGNPAYLAGAMAALDAINKQI